MYRYATALALASMLPANAAHAQPSMAPMTMTGVNIAGAEFGKTPGVLFKDYVYPTPEGISHFAGKGLDTVRLPFRWERLQPHLDQPLDAGELARIEAVVAAVTDGGGYVVLDPHNYARYRKAIVGSDAVPIAAFADFWARLAAKFADRDHVVFGLMNEPHGLPAEDWRDAAQAAIDAIRAAGAGNLILVPGVSWTGAHSWIKSGNGAALAAITDPADNFAFEAHQYLDKDYSGTHEECPRETAGADGLRVFEGWLKEQGRKGFLGEFGAPANPACLQALDAMLAQMDANPDLWLGWTYWAAGAWWSQDYPLSIQPDRSGADRPQLDVLLKHVSK